MSDIIFRMFTVFSRWTEANTLGAVETRMDHRLTNLTPNVAGRGVMTPRRRAVTLKTLKTYRQKGSLRSIEPGGMHERGMKHQRIPSGAVPDLPRGGEKQWRTFRPTID